MLDGVWEGHRARSTLVKLKTLGWGYFTLSTLTQ